MDTNTGELYAMVSAPSFDPNDFVTRLTPEEAAKLNDPILAPMYNRATYGRYPPGSSFKIIVALAALEAGLDPKEIYLSKGYYQFRRGSRRIADTAGEGPFDFERAFYKSSNPYFIEHGLRIGPEKIVEMARRFHLGEPTGLWPEQEAPGVLPSAGELTRLDGSPWTRGDTENLSIGHGELLVTPLQMAVVTAAVANGGKVLQPRLVTRVGAHPGSNEDTASRMTSAQVRGTINVSSNSLNLVKKAMLADVAHPEGSGRRARVPGLSIAAKTGTARLTHGNREKITWLVSYAPFENPRYAVVVLVEGGDFGGTTCGPVAKMIYETIQKRDRAQLPKAQPLAQAGDGNSPRTLTASGRVQIETVPQLFSEH
jgi:penicillin-binding protein 2